MPKNSKTSEKHTKSRSDKTSTDNHISVEQHRVQPSKYSNMRKSIVSKMKLRRSQKASTGSLVKRPKLPAAWIILRQAIDTLRTNWKIFLGITLIYALLMILFVKGFTNTLDAETLQSFLGSGVGVVTNSLLVFVLLADNGGGTANPSAGLYQLLLTLIVGLAIVWALRQVLAGTKIRVRDAYYRGMYPLIPVLLVLLIIGLQLLPIVIGAGLYSMIISKGIAVFLIERILWGIVLLALGIWSMYMITASVFGLYIATLPDMEPLKALRSAREIVRHRRWAVLRKILFLALILLLVSLLIMIPVIIFVTPAAAWVLFLLGIVSVPVVHAFMYGLYRELLK